MWKCKGRPRSQIIINMLSGYHAKKIEERIDAPGAFHHIIARGIERSDIFKDNTDRNNFLVQENVYKLIDH